MRLKVRGLFNRPVNADCSAGKLRFCLSPLSILVAAFQTQNQELSVERAMSELSKELGIEFLSIDPLTDYVEQPNGCIRLLLGFALPNRNIPHRLPLLKCRSGYRRYQLPTAFKLRSHGQGIAIVGQCP